MLANPTLSHPVDPLFAQFVQERVYLKNVSPKTREWYESAWKAFKASQSPGAVPEAVECASLTKAHLHTFVVSLRQRGVSPFSCNTYIKALNAFCRWLHAEGHLALLLRLDPLKTERRFIKTLTPAQVRTLLTFRPRTMSQWRVWTLACALLDTGCRVDEMLGAGETDFDLDNLLLIVNGKGRKQRRVPISLELRKILFRYLKIRLKKGSAHSLMFAARTGSKWGQRNALRSLYLLLKHAGLPRCGFHRLRHTFATTYLRNGGDVVRLSKILGHASITTTMRYVHMLAEDLQVNHAKLSPLNPQL